MNKKRYKKIKYQVYIMVNKIYFFIDKNSYNIEFDDIIKNEYDVVEKIIKRPDNDKFIISVYLDGNEINKTIFDDMSEFIRQVLNEKYINIFYKTSHKEKYLFKNVVPKPIITIHPVSTKHFFIDDD